jgi:hypothetical protein
VPPQAAQDLLARLTRALQRTAIYPPGHPSAGVSTAPVVDALARLLHDQPTLLIGFTSERVFVGLRSDDVSPYEAPWLTTRIAARGIASIEFTSEPALADATRLIEWLARGDDPANGGEPPRFESCVVTRVDYSATRFREAPVQEGRLSPAALAWRAISRSLVTDWYSGTAETPVEPVDLAHCVLHMLDRQEGAGVCEWSERLAGVSSQLASLPNEVRAVVKGRLAEFMAALTPELRGQLLTATPRDSAQKLELLSQMIDRLPRSLVVEVVRNLDFGRGSSTHQFLSLMLKLTTLSAADPQVSQVLGERYGQEGLPPAIVHYDAPQAKRVLEELLARRQDDVVGANPHDYQARLEALSVSTLSKGRGVFDADRHVDPRDACQVSAQTGLVALHLLEAGVDEADLAACLERIQEQLPRFLDDRRFDVLARAARVFQNLLQDRDGLTSAAARHADAGLQFFASPAAVGAVVAALESAEGGLDETLLTLARACGAPLAEAALAEIVTRSEDALHWRLVEVLDALDREGVRSAVTAVHRREPGRSRRLVSALIAAGAGRLLSEVGHAFVGDPDATVRADVCRLLFSGSLGATGAASLLRRTLEDDHPCVVEVGIEAVEKGEAPAAAGAIAALIDASRPPVIEPLQHRLVRVLARHPGPEVRRCLIDLLKHRHGRFDRPSRLLSRTIAIALDRAGGDDEIAAARAWRHSPAGLASRFLGDATKGHP